MRFIGEPLSRERVMAFFKSVLERAALANPDSIYRVIEVMSGSEKKLAGFVRLTKDKIDPEKQAARIGTMLLVEFQRWGLAYQAQKLLLTKAQQRDYCQSFTAYCHINNQRAHRLYQRLGFHKGRQLLYNQQPTIQWQRGI